MLKILSFLMIVIYVFWLPGYLIIRAGFRNSEDSSIHILAFGLGITLVPISSFGIAMLLHTTVQNNLVLTVATLINLLCLIVVIKRKPKTCTS